MNAKRYTVNAAVCLLCLALLSCGGEPPKKEGSCDVEGSALVAPGKEFYGMGVLEDNKWRFKEEAKSLREKLGWKDTHRITGTTVAELKTQLAKDKYKVLYYLGHGEKTQDEFTHLRMDKQDFKVTDIPAKRDFYFVYLCCCHSTANGFDKWARAFSNNNGKATEYGYMGFSGLISVPKARGFSRRFFERCDGTTSVKKAINDAAWDPTAGPAPALKGDAEGNDDFTIDKT